MIILLVILLLAVSQFSANIYTPSLPSMAQELHTSAANIQMSLSLYYLAFGVSQFIYGPLSDSYGRKREVMIGLVIYLMGSLLIIFYPETRSLLLGRFIQGLGVGSGMVVGRAILCDLYEGERLRKISNLLSIVVVFVPMISPLVGAFFEQFYSWKMSFIFLFVFSLLVFFFIWQYLPETNLHPTKRLVFSRVWGAFGNALKQIEFSRYSLCGGFVFSIVAVMYVAFPFLFTRLLGVKPFLLSLSLIAGIFSCILGSMISSFLVKFILPSHLYKIGFSCLVAGLLLGGFFYHFAQASMLTFMLPILTVLMGAGIIFPNAMADALAVPNIPGGIASAIFSGFQMLFAGLASGMMSRLDTSNPLDLILMVGVVSFMALLSYALPMMVRKRS